MAVGNYGWISSEFIGMERAVDDIRFADRTPILQEVSNVKEIYPITSGQDIVGGHERPGLALSPASDNYGWLSCDFGGEFMFNRVWVEPLSFALNFITDDATYDLKIWNAYRDQDISVTNVTVQNQTGTLLDYPSLPDTIVNFGDTIYTLYIYQDGPPLQDTTYTLTIAGNDYVVEITGIRVIPWDLDANWDVDLNIVYEFTSTIYSNEKLYEQRRALSKESWINIKGTYDTSGLKSRRHHNLLMYGHDKVFGVPIYSEKLTPTILVQAGSTITVEEDFTYYYNLNQKSDYIIIVDHVNEMAEIKEISSLVVGSKQINVSQPISNDFDTTTTFVYPCAFCIVKSFRGNMQTDRFDAMMVDFREYKNG
jgi:hypothetical protein